MTLKRYLVVANKTLVGDQVPTLVAERATLGPAEFHILVPATRSRETIRLVAGAADPLTGYTVVSPDDLAASRERDRALAAERLATFVTRLNELEQIENGTTVITSEVGSHEPFRAIAAVLEETTFDEIIISTLPSAVSRWLRMDLPSQIRREFPIPIIVVHPQSD